MSVELVITPSWVNVGGDGKPDLILNEALSTRNPGAYYQNKERQKKWKGLKDVDEHWRLYDMVHRRFPRGLVEQAIGALREHDIDVKVVGASRFTGPVREEPKYLDTFTPRGYQIEAVSAFMKKEFGIISIPTRGGKTPVGLMIASMFAEKYPCLYLVTKIEAQQDVLKSWYEWFDLEMATDEILRSPGLSVITYNAAINRDLSQFKLVIGDEIHRAGAEKFYDAVMRCEDAWFRVGLSGSAGGRSDGRDIYFEGAAGPICYTVERQMLQEAGHCATGKVYTVDVHGSTEPGKTGWLALEKAGIYENAARDYQLIECMLSVRKPGEQVLYVVQKKVHGKRVASILSEILGVKVPFLSSETPKAKRLEYYGKLQRGEILTAVVSPIFDDSMTLPMIKILVNAAAGKSSIATTQRLGRALSGDKAIILIDANDLHHPTLKRHSRARFKIYEREGYACEQWFPTA